MYSYNLRGTNGSGKTRVARHLLEESKAKPILHLGRKVRAYKGDLDGIPLVILGSYETTCGGCDTIDSVAEVAWLLEFFMTGKWLGERGWPYKEMTRDRPHDGIVFFEGLMISHMLGTVGAMQAKLGKQDNILAFLDTPLDKCIEHVMTRRMLRKDHRTFDPKNVIKDHPRVYQSRGNAIRERYRVVDVPWDQSIAQVRQHLRLINQGRTSELGGYPL